MTVKQAFLVLVLAASTLLMPGTAAADSMFGGDSMKTMLEQELEKQHAQRVETLATWRKARDTMIERLVSRGATPEEAAGAIDELITTAGPLVMRLGTLLDANATRYKDLNARLGVLSALSNLGPARFESFVKAQGLTPSPDFYNCLCPARFWYAPSSGGACEGRTLAYSTVIYAELSGDPVVWAACARGEVAGDKSLLDAMIDKVRSLQQRYDFDVCSQLRTVLDATKDLKKLGQLRPTSESFLANNDLEQSFFDFVAGQPVTGVIETALGAASDKIAINLGITDLDSPTGLGFFLTHSGQPSETGLSNPYVRATKVITSDARIDTGDGGQIQVSYEMALASRILQSSGSLAPGDVFRMAVEVTHGDVPLAALVAHNLLKEAAYGRREGAPMKIANIPRDLEGNPADRAIKAAYANAFDRKGTFSGKVFILDPELIRSKLQDIRPPYDPEIDDRLGPWYHSFGLIFVGTDPVLGESSAHLGGRIENVFRLLHLGSGRSLGKEATNRCAAVLVSLMNRNMEAPAKP